MRNFEVAADDATDGQAVTVDFTLGGDDHVFQARKPKSAAIGLLGKAARKGATLFDQIEVAYTFFGGRPDADGQRLNGGVLTPEDWAVVELRLMDPLDDLDVQHLGPMMNYVIEEFAGRPTLSSTAS